MLKLLSWNIQAGGGTRSRSIVNAVGKEKAAIVILSEYRNNDAGVRLRDLLLKAGYRHQAVTQARSNDNSVIIASIMPFSAELHAGSDPSYGHNIISAHFDAFSIMGVYLPHKKKHVLFPAIKKIVSSADRPYIIAGDYNSGFNYIDQLGKSFWYTDELASWAEAGYEDAFRLVNQDAKEYSWYSHQGNGFRYDHTYIHESLKPILKDCYYLHKVRADKLSDHSAMILEVG